MYLQTNYKVNCMILKYGYGNSWDILFPLHFGLTLNYFHEIQVVAIRWPGHWGPFAIFNQCILVKDTVQKSTPK